MSRTAVTASQIIVDTGLTRATFYRWRQRGWIPDPTGEVATGDGGPPLKTWPPEVIDQIRARLAERAERRRERARKRLAK